MTYLLTLMSYFQSKIIAITGAGSGLGKALAMQLAELKSILYLSDINWKSVELVMEQININGGKAYAQQLDVSKYDAFENVVQQIIDTEGRLDIMINNAGFAQGGLFEDLDLDVWERAINVNFLGSLYGTKLAYDQMIIQGGGQIVNISSVYGQVPASMIIPYTTTKSAVFTMTRSLRWEAKYHNIKVNVVTPGTIDTKFIPDGAYARITAKDAFDILPFPLNKMITAEKAARKIIRGMKRNRAVIAFPYYVRPYWWVYRIAPGLLGWIYELLAVKLRKKRVSGD
ncbi:MAG: SDR family oxidoreductase [Candidatus Heimdallarchaeota archaeon]|nr:SDR family oxidoreductase [Candidatus Heimdallarchaeota archaeon]